MFREYVRHDGNSFFNFVIAAAAGGDRELLRDARLTLRLFPLEKRNFSIDLSADPLYREAEEIERQIKSIHRQARAA